MYHPAMTALKWTAAALVAMLAFPARASGRCVQALLRPRRIAFTLLLASGELHHLGFLAVPAHCGRNALADSGAGLL